MTELRSKMREAAAEALCDAEGMSTYGQADAVVDAILALPEIADALKLKMVKPLNLGPSISTGTRRADD